MLYADDLKENYPEPAPLWFRSKAWPAGTRFASQSLPWGRLMYSMSGFAEVATHDAIYLSTSEYAIWLPPHTEHQSLAKNDIQYVIIHIEKSFCEPFPTTTKTLRLNDIAKAIISDFSTRNIDHPASRFDKTLARALIEQLQISREFNSYLPSGNDELIKKMTTAMNEGDGIKNNLTDWARLLGLSERSLSRRFVNSVGISFNEWRGRKKMLMAVTLLHAGNSVKAISYALGYSNPSAFIAMFKKRIGRAPAEFISRR